MDAHEQEVRDCCSLVLDIAEREIFEVRETAVDGVDEEIREEILRQLDRIVQLIVTISPHICHYLWRDLFFGCISYFYHLFYWMEDWGIINIDSVTDICCLHT